jgi:glutamate-1-semialdehyde 2,1-aminomutase
MAKGAGPILTDVDGNEYVDYVCGGGALILGHADETVEAAVCKAAAKGCCFAAPVELEAQLAELVVSRFPSIEMLRWVDGHTEAVLGAIRLARTVTGRDKIITCAGCHHGAAPAVSAGVGQGAAASGVPASATADTLVVPYNDVRAVAGVVEQNAATLAAVLVEPIACHMGLVPPQDGYLKTLRDLCDRVGALLIFDERTTGLRVAPGGAQELYQVDPDLTCLGGILGGGLPLAAYGGRGGMMEGLSVAEEAWGVGGNPVAMAAGIAVLQALAEPGVYGQLEERSAQWADGISGAAAEADVPMSVVRVGSVGWATFTDRPVTDLGSADRCDSRRYARYFNAMLERGVHLAPSPLECSFVSLSHESEHVERTVEAATEALGQIAAQA